MKVAFSSLSVRALPVPGTSARNENLRPLLNTNIPLISGKYGFRNHFWPPESRFLMSKSEKNAFFSKPFDGLILIFWNLILYTSLCTKIKRFTIVNFFFSWCMFLSHVSQTTEYSATQLVSSIKFKLSHAISGKYGLRNHFWPLQNGFLKRKSEKKGLISKSPQLPILRLTFLESSYNLKKKLTKTEFLVPFFDWVGLQDPCTPFFPFFAFPTACCGPWQR